MKITINGVEREATPEEQAAIEAQRALDAAPKPATTADVNAERDRRIYLPKAVSLTTGKNFAADMGGDSRSNISDLGIAAVAKKAAGITTPISFRDANNVDHDLTNDEVIEMGLQIAAQVQAIHIKARAIKAMDPIPDPKNDALWD